MRRGSFVSKLARLGVLSLMGMAFSGQALAGYVFTELSPLSGGQSSIAFAINDSGQIVGTTDFAAPCFGCGGSTTATMWEGGAAAGLQSLGLNTYAIDINGSGQVVGYSSARNTTAFTAVTWIGGAMVPLPSLGDNSDAQGINSFGLIAGATTFGGSGPSATVWGGPTGTVYYGADTSATDINDLGQMAGNSNGQAVLLEGGTVTSLATPDSFSKAEAINNLGQIVGWTRPSSGISRAVLWEGSAATDLGTLDGYSYASGLNDLMQVVGSSYDEAGLLRAFLWEGGTMFDLNSLLDSETLSAGWRLVDAQDINELGQIVGRAINTITGQQSGFLLSPTVGTVPEPGAYALMLVGLGMMTSLAMRQRRRNLA